MQDHHRMSDEIPVADAVEQSQETAPEPLDQVDAPTEAPIEAATPDWQEQSQEVVGEDDRDMYRE